MKNLKITKGEWTYKKHSPNPDLESRDLGYYILNNEQDGWGQWIASVSNPNLGDTTIKEAEANAQLIADVGTTANKCGKLPSELLAERDELVKAIEYLLNAEDDGTWNKQASEDFARKAINKTLSK